MCSVAAISGVQQNLKLFLVLDHQYAQSHAARFLSLVLTFSIVGHLTMGWLADRFHPKYVMVSIYSLVGIAIPIVILSQSRSSLYVFTAVFGIGLGGDYMIISLVTAEIFSMEMLGRLLGVILTAQGVAESVSPWVMGPHARCLRQLRCWISCARRFGVSGRPRSLRIAKANERGMSRSDDLAFCAAGSSALF
jgi:MFS family permease